MKLKELDNIQSAIKKINQKIKVASKPTKIKTPQNKPEKELKEMGTATKGLNETKTRMDELPPHSTTTEMAAEIQGNGMIRVFKCTSSSTKKR